MSRGDNTGNGFRHTKTPLCCLPPIPPAPHLSCRETVSNERRTCGRRECHYNLIIALLIMVIIFFRQPFFDAPHLYANFARVPFFILPHTLIVASRCVVDSAGHWMGHTERTGAIPQGRTICSSTPRSVLSLSSPHDNRLSVCHPIQSTTTNTWLWLYLCCCSSGTFVFTEPLLSELKRLLALIVDRGRR